jgi:hypothetical protein
MSLEVIVICDDCGMVLDGASTGREARRKSKDEMGAKTGLPGGRDFCRECAAKR